MTTTEAGTLTILRIDRSQNCDGRCLDCDRKIDDCECEWGPRWKGSFAYPQERICDAEVKIVEGGKSPVIGLHMKTLDGQQWTLLMSPANAERLGQELRTQAFDSIELADMPRFQRDVLRSTISRDIVESD